ncbi:hypothetical protein R3W88_033360 [Solanum pinnatisectum]|uniref:Uncharacterized protein n=1 Tax=Solanum pinnatisectum TaxID=50273 RepID=A0AAV9K1H8_9SOLN|nr:hypothetical protein R3W88_033360 [Solanum pinnatisectum]
MNRMDLSPMKLLNELTTMKSTIKKENPLSVACMVDKPIASSSKLAKAQKKKKKLCKVVEPGSARCGVTKPKGKCYHCK